LGRSEIMSRRKSRQFLLWGILVLFLLMFFTVPSTQEYHEWLTEKYRINCDSIDCIHSTIDPMTESIEHLPFIMIGETYIFDDTKNSIKAIGVFNVFITIRNNLKSKEYAYAIKIE